MFEEDLRVIPVVNREICTGCEDCMEVCPPQAIVMRDDVAFIIDNICEECSECVEECPEEAITLPIQSR